MSNIGLARLLLAAMFEAAQMVIFAQRGNMERARKSEVRFKLWQAALDEMESEDK